MFQRTLPELDSLPMPFVTLALLTFAVLAIRLGKALLRIDTVISFEVFDSLFSMEHFVQAYVVQAYYSQLCATALLLAVVMHLNIEAQTLDGQVLSQGLGVVSMTAALSCIFLLHLTTQALSLIMTSDNDAFDFLEDVHRIRRDVYFSAPAILGAPKRMLYLSFIMFVGYRTAHIAQDVLGLKFLPADELDLQLRVGVCASVAVAILSIFAYTALVTKAFIALIKPPRAETSLPADDSASETAQ